MRESIYTKLTAAVIATGTALLISAPALAHHSVAAVYKGTTAGGGSVEFRVNAGGTYVDGFTVLGVATSCGKVDHRPYASSGDPIESHAFVRPAGSLRYEGTFDARGRARGTLSSYQIGGCQSAPVSWTAATDVPPTACGDYADNDGDGKTDLADPGCTRVADDDETDPDFGPVCPWKPGCPGFVDDPPAAADPRPVLSGLAVTRGGRRITYHLSEPASVSFRFRRLVRGRYVALRSVHTQIGARGRNSLALGRRAGTTRLRRGRYEVTVVARDGADQHSSAVRKRFRVRR